MKVILLKCPQCGARLRAEPSAATVICEYCNSEAVVQKRTGLLARSQPAPSRVVHGQVPMPVAVQQRSGSGLLLGLLVLGAVVGVTAIFVSSSRSKTSEVVRKLQRPAWSGIQAAALVDLTDDGVPDIIGRLRILQPVSTSVIGAFDGSTGEPLWVSEALGEMQHAYAAPLAVAHGVVLMGDGSAGLNAFKANDGTTLWKIRLNEKVSRLCARDQGQVLVITADDKGHPVTVADGSLHAAIDMKEQRCAPLPSDDHRDGADPDVTVYEWSNEYSDRLPRDKIEGMTSRAALHHQPSGTTIALGQKTPGTRFGMVASYSIPVPPEQGEDEFTEQIRNAPNAKARRMLKMMAASSRRSKSSWEPQVHWKSQVPGTDPLATKASAPEPEHVALNADYLVVAYEGKDHGVYRLTAIRTAKGTRAWDIALPDDSPLSSVFATKTHVMVSRWQALHVYDLATGAHAFSID